MKNTRFCSIIDVTLCIDHFAWRVNVCYNYDKARLDFGREKVIVLSLLSALFAVALNLINLYIAHDTMPK